MMQSMSLLDGRRTRCVPACLFGVPDPLKLEKMYQEAVMESQENFAIKWGLNLLTMQPSQRPRVPQEDRLAAAAEVDVATPPEGRVQDAEVNTVRPVGSRRQPLRYSPYQKQQKLTDYWPTTKAPSQAFQIKHHPNSSEDGHTFSSSQTPNI